MNKEYLIFTLSFILFSKKKKVIYCCCYSLIILAYIFGYTQQTHYISLIYYSSKISEKKEMKKVSVDSDTSK
jgi:hypothetical protein